MKTKTTIHEIVTELEADVGILITADENNGISMSAAARDTEGEMVVSQWMSQICDIIYRKGSLKKIKAANRLPL